MKHVSPAAVPFMNVPISVVEPVLEFELSEVEEGRVKVTLVKDVKSCRRGVGGCGVK
jgi:hypothetical protein